VTRNHTAVIPGENPGDKTEFRPWTTVDLDDLRRLAGSPVEEIVAALGRSAKSIHRAAERHGISLRRPGEHRGRVLGVPPEIAALARTVRVLEQIRADVRAGAVDATRMVRLIKLTKAGAPLCTCGLRPQEVVATGLCLNCHARSLAHAHAHDLDRVEARRELDAERQRKHRRRRAGGKEKSA
jgi:hypothetical protein